MNDNKYSHLARYRRYYEHLSMAFQDVVGNRRQSLTLEYYERFKQKIYLPLIISHLMVDLPRVLDVGCGTGRDLAALTGICAMKGTGVDFSINNLTLAQKTGQSSVHKICWVQSPAEQLPFADSIFDVVLFGEVIEHLLDPALALAEIRRVLTPNGRLFITTPNRYSYFSLISESLPKRLKYALKPLIWNMPRDYDASSHYLDDPQIKRHVKEFGPGQLKSFLKESGFTVEVLRGGALAVPIPSLFDRWAFVRWIWKWFDRIVTLVPGSVYLKDSLIVMTKPVGEYPTPAKNG